jgi:hypothetical protein
MVLRWREAFRQGIERIAHWGKSSQRNLTPHEDTLRWNTFLHGLGWEPGKGGLEKISLPDGFELFPAAADVLAKYGGCFLEVKPELPHYKYRVGGPSALIDPQTCVNMYSQLINDFSKYLAAPVYPIGIFAFQDECGIVITPKGHVYALLGCTANPFAVNFEDALRCWLYDDRDTTKDTVSRMEGSGMVIWKERRDAWEKSLMTPRDQQGKGIENGPTKGS